MSPLDRPVPPTGEEIHIPGPSAQPILLTIGVTVTLLGITNGLIILIPGLLLTLLVIVAWIRDARREYEHLPLEHHVELQETASAETGQRH